MNETSEVTWSRLRQLVKKRDESKCYHCKTIAEDGHCDHLIPISKGGTDAIDNLVWSCKSCNLKKGNKMPFISKTFIYEELPRNYPNFKLLMTEIVVGIIGILIPPYPEYSKLEFVNLNYYWSVILKTRKRQPLTTWIRDRLWTIPSNAEDTIAWDNTKNKIIKVVNKFSA